jgi:hypothetical protein
VAIPDSCNPVSVFGLQISGLGFLVRKAIALRAPGVPPSDKVCRTLHSEVNDRKVIMKRNEHRNVQNEAIYLDSAPPILSYLELS